jgi:hypothetical protein
MIGKYGQGHNTLNLITIDAAAATSDVCFAVFVVAGAYMCEGFGGIKSAGRTTCCCTLDETEMGS